MNAIATQPFQPFIQGFILSISLIISFGPQNIYLLQQGLRRHRLFTTVIVFIGVDFMLISLGVGGVGTTLASNQQVLVFATLGGAAFLMVYAGRSFRVAWQGQSSLGVNAAPTASLSLKGSILMALSFSLLNPAAYIDTLLLIGTTSGHYAIDNRMIFGLGAVTASAVWFFTLAYGSRCLVPLFRHPAAWRTLDIASGCIMTGLAVSLCSTQLG